MLRGSVQKVAGSLANAFNGPLFAIMSSSGDLIC